MDQPNYEEAARILQENWPKPSLIYHLSTTNVRMTEMYGRNWEPFVQALRNRSRRG